VKWFFHSDHKFAYQIEHINWFRSFFHNQGTHGLFGSSCWISSFSNTGGAYSIRAWNIAIAEHYHALEWYFHKFTIAFSNQFCAASIANNSCWHFGTIFWIHIEYYLPSDLIFTQFEPFYIGSRVWWSQWLAVGHQRAPCRKSRLKMNHLIVNRNFISVSHIISHVASEHLQYHGLNILVKYHVRPTLS
jgi:hypothetical protein